MATEDQAQRHQRIREARQILAGDMIRPSPDPWVMASGALPLSPLQRNYLLVLLGLFAIGLVLLFTLGLGAASVPLFVLALGLIVSWLVF